ncbi:MULTISPECIES: hypothetical protein [unclassified Leisingera]|uniref:hypothetical protein n=1 Tax=unclassified Leisingera TaxID=2614906 RepID=UPI0005806B57|nr:MULTISPECIES: hypothetical protein [unclassified Leisingera]KIC14625.1 hypothetical protein RA21_18970 [Leisingera sp. ANG-DT]KIC34641.1 hypothetical protein RA25_02325 [Leisingera sp. ANG-S5]
MDEKNQNAPGGEPEAWAGAQTKLERQKRIWSLLFWGLLIAGSIFLVTTRLADGEYFGALVFGLLGVVYLYRSARTVIEWRKETQP